MKLYFTAQQGVITIHGARFAEYIYDHFELDSYFRLKDVQYAPFLGLVSAPVYQRMLLAWMIEQAPDCIEKVGRQLYHILPAEGRSPLTCSPQNLAL